jgi:hypothetical protein
MGGGGPNTTVRRHHETVTKQASVHEQKARYEHDESQSIVFHSSQFLLVHALWQFLHSIGGWWLEKFWRYVFLFRSGQQRFPRH